MNILTYTQIFLWLLIIYTTYITIYIRKKQKSNDKLEKENIALKSENKTLQKTQIIQVVSSLHGVLDRLEGQSKKLQRNCTALEENWENQKKSNLNNFINNFSESVSRNNQIADNLHRILDRLEGQSKTLDRNCKILSEVKVETSNSPDVKNFNYLNLEGTIDRLETQNKILERNFENISNFNFNPTNLDIVELRKKMEETSLVHQELVKTLNLSIRQKQGFQEFIIRSEQIVNELTNSSDSIKDQTDKLDSTRNIFAIDAKRIIEASKGVVQLHFDLEDNVLQQEKNNKRIRDSIINETSALERSRKQFINDIKSIVNASKGVVRLHKKLGYDVIEFQRTNQN